MNQVKQKPKRTTIGGQALIEGIMMKGPDKIATVCRKPDGELSAEVSAYVPPHKKNKILGFPVIRGVWGFGSLMRLGIRTLEYSAGIAAGDIRPEDQSKFEKWLEKTFGAKKLEKAVMGLALFLGISFPIVLYFLLPSFISGLFEETLGTGVVRNLVEGFIRVLIFILFLFSVSKMKDMRRVFSYHGAEHKSIACYEAGEELTVENVRKHSRKHPRCGTSFLFVVMIVSIIVLSLLSAIPILAPLLSNVWLRTLFKLALLPLIIGLSYEANRFAGRHDHLLCRILRAPGIALQSFTTYEPDDGMIEVGIESLKLVIPEDGESDTW